MKINGLTQCIYIRTIVYNNSFSVLRVISRNFMAILIVLCPVNLYQGIVTFYPHGNTILGYSSVWKSRMGNSYINAGVFNDILSFLNSLCFMPCSLIKRRAFLTIIWLKNIAPPQMQTTGARRCSYITTFKPAFTI